MNFCPSCQHQNRPGAKFCGTCGTKLLPRNAEGHLLPDVMLENRYKIDQVLGGGGFGIAYRAEDTRLKRDCVIKEMLIPPRASRRDIRARQENFEREGQSLVALNHPGHPNIPEIYDFFSTASGYYLVMKYIEGQDLAKMLLQQQDGRLPWKEAVKIALAICDVLVYMHARQPDPVLHRDIKPANILVDQMDRIWLVDFGLSKAQPTTAAAAGGSRIAGTPGYTPIEQWAGKAEPASDIYALGATLHHLVTGHDPRKAFTSFNLAKTLQQHENFAPLRQVDPKLPAELERLVSDALEAEPKQRPTASQWKQDLEALLRIRPFHFKNGDIARTPIDLVRLSQQHWAEARDNLYNGLFEKWLTSLHQADLVKQSQNVIQQVQNKDIALDNFLRILEPNLPAPRVEMKTDRTDFAHYDPLASTAVNAQVKIINHGPGCFVGTSKFDAPWLRLNQKEFVIPPGYTLDLMIDVRSNLLEWNTTYTNQLVIDGNSTPQKIEFSLRTRSRFSSRGAMMRILGFSGGLPAAIWGAVLGTPLGVISWLWGIKSIQDAPPSEIEIYLAIILGGAFGLISGLIAYLYKTGETSTGMKSWMVNIIRGSVFFVFSTSLLVLFFIYPLSEYENTIQNYNLIIALLASLILFIVYFIMFFFTLGFIWIFIFTIIRLFFLSLLNFFYRE